MGLHFHLFICAFCACLWRILIGVDDALELVRVGSNDNDADDDEEEEAEDDHEDDDHGDEDDE